MRVKPSLFSLCLFFASFSVAADERPDATAPLEKTPGFEILFKTGLESYQKKDYAQAKASFASALDAQPGNVAAAVNLALSYCQLGQAGPCLAYFRKALWWDPQSPDARQGFDYAWSKLEVKEIPHRLETYEVLRDRVLNRFHLDQFLAVTAACFFAAGWVTLSAVGRRRRALEDEMAPPAWPVSSPFLLTLTVLMIALSVMKIYDTSLPRGTILEEKVGVLSAPEATGVPLFDLYAGFEVILKNRQGDWIQVTYPGALSGWIPKSSVLRTSGGPSN